MAEDRAVTVKDLDKLEKAIIDLGSNLETKFTALGQKVEKEITVNAVQKEQIETLQANHKSLVNKLWGLFAAVVLVGLKAFADFLPNGN